MARRMISALIPLSFIVSAACGSSITEPAPVQQSVTTIETGTPPPPAPPTSPAPTPTPGPAPTPTPAPGPTVEYYDAEVTTVFWTPPSRPLFGSRFTIEVWRERGEVWLNSTRLWIVQRDADSVIASDQNPNGNGGPYTVMATVNTKTRQWSFNGLVGSGGGSVTLRETR